MTRQPIDETAGVTAKGPVSGVQVLHHMEFGPNALTFPLDTKLVIQILFMLGEKARQGPNDEPIIITPATLLERLRSLGVVSGNGTKLVGRDAVYESFARIITKGYIRRVEPKDERGKRVGPVEYEFYEWPAWNPEPPQKPVADASASLQVGAASGIAGSGDAGSGRGKRTKSASPQVRSTSGNAGSGNAGSGSNVRTSAQVASTSGNAGHPPHPPEEVDTSSPYPLTGTKSGLASQREEAGAGFAQEDLAAAEDVLQLLNKPWTAGRRQAQELAPLLLTVMREQGWPDIQAVDRALLSAELTKNPGGVRSYARVLKNDRIPNLVRYAVVTRAAAKPSSVAGRPGGAAMCARHPGFEEGDCSPCRIAERERTQRGRSEPAPVDGAGLLARLRANLPTD